MRPNNEILIDYMDQQLSREESFGVETLLRNDTQAAGELLYLKLAVETVRLDAIQEKVSAIRLSFEKNQTSTEPAKTIVRSMYKISMRVAAIFILFIGASILYKYMSVTNQSVYEKQFAAYELSNTRGQETVDAETQAYQSKNWKEVTTIFNTVKNKTNKSVFLAAMAEMELKHFPQAVLLFENILRSGDNAYQEEAEYYVSLAYLMNHEENKAVLILDKIKADTSHTYYPMVSNISAIDLKIIELKK
jgi:hypothetical protein